jgi:hypothetical protein
VKARASRQTSRRCPRPSVMREEFDAYHVSARACWAVTQRPTGESGVAVTIVLAELISGRRAGWYNLEQAPAFGESGFAAAVAEEPVVTDTLHVKQEAANELRRIELHHALCGFMAIVFPAERDVSISDIDQAIVRDGDAMRVTAQAAEYLLRAAERFAYVTINHTWRPSLKLSEHHGFRTRANTKGRCDKREPLCQIFFNVCWRFCDRESVADRQQASRFAGLRSTS